MDPDLHAGILDDVRRARNGEVSWVFPRPEEPSRNKALHHGPSPRRPISAGEIDELQRDYGHSSQESGRKLSNDRVPVLGLSVAQLRTKKATPPTKTSCPHEDCSHLKVHKYRLERTENEDVSEMALHLLRDHHTTPFPCGEDDCLQKGERGYFTQNDLVKHVKAAHPDVEALDRLRGRVDSTLLGEDNERVCIDLTRESPESERKVSIEKEFDFLRTSNLPSNSTILSSSPGPDRTVTPVTFGDRLAGGASNSTPLTSFSSLAVNRSSVTVQRREISDSQEHEMPTEPDLLLPTLPSTRNDSLEPGLPSSRMNSFEPNPSLRNWSKGPTSEPHQLLGLSSDPFLPRAAGTNIEPISVGQPHHDISQRPSPYLEPQPNIRHNMVISKQSFVEESNSMAPQIQPSSNHLPRTAADYFSPPSGNDILPISDLARPKKVNGSKQSRTSETFTRNVIHPSHEFSDEEGPMPPPKITRPPPSTLVALPHAPIAPPTTPVVEVFKKPSVPLPVTPTIKKKAPNKAVQRVADQEDDLDELSLGPDDFKVISSHTKALPQVTFGAYMGIKREATVGPAFSSAKTSRKRRFSDIAADEVDELGADECFGKSTGTHKRIKKEIDLNRTPMVHRIKAQRKQAKKMHRDELNKGPMGTPLPLGSALANRQMGRSGTPLLDLTPDRRRLDSYGTDREVFDSDDSVPSSGLRQELPRSTVDFVARTPYDGLLTPSRSKQGSLDPLKLAKTAVVVKTPGGTFRKCGEGAFRCGRTFCFRCGHSDGMVVN